jgi:hypothetical protein
MRKLVGGRGSTCARSRWRRYATAAGPWRGGRRGSAARAAGVDQDALGVVENLARDAMGLGQLPDEGPKAHALHLAADADGEVFARCSQGVSAVCCRRTRRAGPDLRPAVRAPGALPGSRRCGRGDGNAPRGPFAGRSAANRPGSRVRRVARVKYRRVPRGRLRRYLTRDRLTGVRSIIGGIHDDDRLHLVEDVRERWHFTWWPASSVTIGGTSVSQRLARHVLFPAAPRLERAAGRRVHRRGDIALQHDVLLLDLECPRWEPR